MAPEQRDSIQFLLINTFPYCAVFLRGNNLRSLRSNINYNLEASCAWDDFQINILTRGSAD